MASLSLHLEVGCLGWAEWPIKQPVTTAQVKCCGWVSHYNWTENEELMGFTKTTYPCSCEKIKEEDNQLIVKKGFCEPDNSTVGKNNAEDWPVNTEVCVGLAARLCHTEKDRYFSSWMCPGPSLSLLPSLVPSSRSAHTMVYRCLEEPTHEPVLGRPAAVVCRG